MAAAAPTMDTVTTVQCRAGRCMHAACSSLCKKWSPPSPDLILLVAAGSCVKLVAAPISTVQHAGKAVPGRVQTIMQRGCGSSSARGRPANNQQVMQEVWYSRVHGLARQCAVA